MNLFYYLLALVGVAFILAVTYIIVFAIQNKAFTKKQLRYYSFLFRFWLIGKYHCKTTDITYRLFNALNRLFWGVMCIGLALVLAKVIEGVLWIL